MTYEMQLREISKEEKLAMVIAMLKENLSISLIARITKLSLDKIKKIALQNGLTVVE